MGIYDMVLHEEVINPSINTTNEHHDHDGDYEA
jgi:hypothetical protein